VKLDFKLEDKENSMNYSIIIMVEERTPNFAKFVQTLDDLFSARRKLYEIIIIANGTASFVKNELKRIDNLSRNVKAFIINKKVPQAVCLNAGFNQSKGNILLICGSYQQIKKESYKRLIEALDADTDIINPWRCNRVDPKFNQIQSRIFNKIVNIITQSQVKDLSCNVKVIRRKVLENVKLYGNMYRFLPIVAANKGFRYKDVKCEHDQEFGKTGFYSLRIYFGRVIDILTLYFNLRFTKKPLRFFSLIGTIFVTIGLLLLAGIILQKILFGYPIGNRIELLLSILLITLGLQAASVGLLGEILTFTYGNIIKEYSIEKILAKEKRS
jgi:hypothetical protein